MADWGKVAAIVAIATVPIYASPLILQPAFRKVEELVAQVYYRNNKCDSIQWQHLHHGPIKSLASRTSSPTTSSHQGQVSGIDAMVKFLHNVWQVNPRPTTRPSYLSINKHYLRLDSNVLLALVLLDGGSGAPDHYPGSDSSCVLRFGSTAARFRIFEQDQGTFIIGSLIDPPQFRPLPISFNGIRKEDLRAIGDGYPPFYRATLKTNSGTEIPHPIQGMRDIHRAGWVLAVGFSAFPPIQIYDRRQMTAYSEACDRVLEMLQRLQSEFISDAVLLKLAVKVVTRMNGYRSGSGALAVTSGTVLLDGKHATIGQSLSVPQLSFVLKFANEYRDDALSTQEKQQIGPILQEVLRAAVYGVFTWWQYVNDVNSRSIPGWLLDDRVKLAPVWLESSHEGGG